MPAFAFLNNLPVFSYDLLLCLSSNFLCQLTARRNITRTVQLAFLLFWFRFWARLLESPSNALLWNRQLWGELSLWRYSIQGCQLAGYQVLPNFCCERLDARLLELLNVFNQSLRPARKKLLLSFDWLQVHGLFAFVQKRGALEISLLIITSFWLREIRHLNSVLIFGC